MEIVIFLTKLAGATMLLLYAVRMVRTGIERSFGASFQRVLTSKMTLLNAGLVGVGLAIVLQSSAAVALLASGFSMSGYIGFGTGLAVVLGGDLGSAIIIQILSFKLDWLIPLLLAFGGWMFVKVEQKSWRQLGRVLMGIAFILISLQFLREAVDPIRESAFLPAVADYLAADFMTAFLVGACLAFVMHSSVAAILMCVTLVQIDAIPFAAALSLVLGANFGSAFIPVWLTRGMPTEARRIVFANLFLRGSGAIVFVLIVNLSLDASELLLASPAQSLINAHIGFNLALLLVCLPICRRFEWPIAVLFPEKVDKASETENLTPESALDLKVADNPPQAIASLKRELLRMIELVETMHRPVLDMYSTGDPDQIHSVRDRDSLVNTALDQIRGYVSELPRENYSKGDEKIVRGLMEYAIRLETAGDVISKRLTKIAGDKRKQSARFSSEGWSELAALHETISANLKLAANVLVSDDLESARLLMTEKSEMKRAEYTSRKRHLKRLQRGLVVSLGSSDMHLESLRAFRELNSHISFIAYPILYRNGQLLETRLVQDVMEA